MTTRSFEDTDQYAAGLGNLDERLSGVDFSSIDAVRVALDDLILWRDGLTKEAGTLRDRLATTNALIGTVSLAAQALKYGLDDYMSGGIGEEGLESRIRDAWGSPNPEVNPR